MVQEFGGVVTIQARQPGLPVTCQPSCVRNPVIH